MSGSAIDSAVVGAGPAGLAASAALSARGVEHVVLLATGSRWRGQACRDG
jgi:putative flavoprotein involved in K+ transport